MDAGGSEAEPRFQATLGEAEQAQAGSSSRESGDAWLVQYTIQTDHIVMHKPRDR